MTAIYRVKILEFAKTRDYYPAYCAALILNYLSKDSTVTPEELLNYRYPTLKGDVTVTEYDTDFGAQGDWRGLRDAMRGRGE